MLGTPPVEEVEVLISSDIESLREYFEQFGEVIECTVMRDSSTGRSRGFGFLTFKDAKTVNIVMVKEHFLDGKIVSSLPLRSPPTPGHEGKNPAEQAD